MSRKNIMHLIINDLISIGAAGHSLHSIRVPHIVKLIEHWRRKNLSPRTMANRLAVFRTFLKLSRSETVLPANRKLGIETLAKQHSISVIPDDIEMQMSHVEHSASRSILSFQIYMGLTAGESLRLCVDDALHDGRLVISRALASNGKERMVELTMPLQHQAIEKRKKLLQGHRVFADICDEKSLMILYRTDLKLCGMNPSMNYRKYYFRQRRKILLAAMCEADACRHLMRESGVTSRFRLKELLS